MLACIAAQAQRRAANLPAASRPRWLSFDNASNHNLQAADIPAGFWRVPLSACSPDIHKLIEHTFARFKARLHALIYEECVARGVAQPPTSTVRALVERALREVTAPATIAADQATLPVTLGMIAHDEDEDFSVADGRHFVGTGGGWARERFR